MPAATAPGRSPSWPARLTPRSGASSADPSGNGGHKMDDHYRPWTLTADLSAADLQLRASRVLGFVPPVTDGIWASIHGMGCQPPQWMVRPSEQLEIGRAWCRGRG